MGRSAGFRTYAVIATSGGLSYVVEIVFSPLVNINVNILSTLNPPVTSVPENILFTLVSQQSVMGVGSAYDPSTTFRKFDPTNQAIDSAPLFWSDANGDPEGYIMSAVYDSTTQQIAILLYGTQGIYKCIIYTV